MSSFEKESSSESETSEVSEELLYPSRGLTTGVCQESYDMAEFEVPWAVATHISNQRYNSESDLAIHISNQILSSDSMV